QRIAEEGAEEQRRCKQDAIGKQKFVNVGDLARRKLELGSCRMHEMVGMQGHQPCGHYHEDEYEKGRLGPMETHLPPAENPVSLWHPSPYDRLIQQPPREIYTFAFTASRGLSIPGAWFPQPRWNPVFSTRHQADAETRLPVAWRIAASPPWPW